MTITLYDIPSTIPGIVWSPNTVKVRIALNYKGLPFRTEWVEYPDIEPLCKKIGASPTSRRQDGRDLLVYTLPVIHDSTTGKVISDSYAIAEYLDATYTDGPALFPPGSHASIALCTPTLDRIFICATSIIIPATCSKLNPPSAEFYRRTREELFGCTLEEYTPKGAKREEIWRELEKELDGLSRILDKNGPGKPFLLGDTFSFGDTIIIGVLFRSQKVLEQDEWRRIASWNDGRWSMLLQTVEKYYQMGED